MKKQIIFITPYFNSGGSEYYLYELFDHINNDLFYFELISDYPGHYTQNKQPYKVHINPFSYKPNYFRLNKWINKLFQCNLEHQYFKRIVNKIKPDLCYINTVVIPRYAAYCKKMNLPFVVHLHELPSVYDIIPQGEFDFLINEAKAIICCSEVVKENIVRIRKENVFVQHEHINISPQTAGTKFKPNLPNGGFFWLMSGMKSYRKGYDLVPQVCKAIKPYNGFLIWAGSDRAFGINSLVKRSRPENFIETGPLDQNIYRQLFNHVQGFVLLSREDPFPLVMIEAASHGLPIVAFNSGGVSEFVIEGMGKVLPNQDINELTNAMIEIMQNKKSFNEQTSINRASSFDVKIKAKEWEKLILNICES